MSRTVYITKGSELSFMDGIYKVEDINDGRLVYGVFTDYMDISVKRPLTLAEIAHELKEVDGLNHNVLWDN